MNHIQKIAGLLEQYELDAMLITSEPGERYALGMHLEGMTIIHKNGAHVSTDGRYIEAAREQVTGAEIVQIRPGQGHLALAGDYIQAHGWQQVGFESGHLTVDAYHLYCEGLECLLVPAQKLLDELRAGKDADEIAAMKKAQAITDEAFTEILNYLHPGCTEQEVAARLAYEMMRRGGEKQSFDIIVAAGQNGSRPHAVPGGRVIELGMFVTMDFGCVVQGYCSDMTRTVAVGRPTQEMEEVYDTVLKAQLAGIRTARAGISGSVIDGAARAVIEAAGYGPYFSHSFGHSLGLEIHEGPNAAASETRLMPVGAVVSAEPGIYLPGRFGVRIEDVLILGETGCEDITKSEKGLIVL